MHRILALTWLLASAVFVGSAAAASGSDDDKKNDTVETRLLKILRERGILTEKEFEELKKVGIEMRAADVQTSAAIEREIAELSESLGKQAADSARASAPPVKTTYKIGKGVTFTDDETFAMTIGGYMQIRFTYIDAAGATSQGQDDRASFDVRRARLDINGFAFTKDLEYKILYELATSPGLRDAYLDYRIADELHVRAGQMKRPFSRQQWTSDMDLELPDRVSAVERFRSVVGDRDVGLLGWGFIEKQLFEWYLGIYNGDGLNNGTPNIVNLGPNATGLNVANSSNDDSSGLETVARFVVNPFGPPGYSEGDLLRTEDPKLAIGFQAAYDPERRGNPLGIAAGPGGIPAGQLPQYSVFTTGPDFALKYMGIFVTAECYWRSIQAEGGLADAPGHFHYSTETGGFAQAGYFLGQEKDRGFEVVGRYAAINFDNNIVPIGGTTQIHDWTGGVNYYFAGHNLALQAAYTYRVNEFRGPSIPEDDQIFQLQAQLRF